MILIAFCGLDDFLQFLQPTKHKIIEQIQMETDPQSVYQHKLLKPHRGRSTYSSVSFSFFLFRHWKSESFAATTLFISSKIPSCSILCCSKSFVSAWINLKHQFIPPRPLDLTCTIYHKSVIILLELNFSFISLNISMAKGFHLPELLVGFDKVDSSFLSSPF